MWFITAENLQKFAQAQEEKKTALETLVAKPFSLANSAQRHALHLRLNQFELHLHKMHLLQTAMPLFSASSLLWTAANQLPFTGLFLPLFSLGCYLGLVGMALMLTSRLEFLQQVEELQTLYNWVMKENQETYQSHINNEEKLKQKDIQRLLLLLAPLCSIDFMIAWSKVSAENENASAWQVTGLMQQAMRFFSANLPQDDEQAYILQLKKDVETGQLQGGLLQGLGDAGRYFKGPEFRTMAKEEFFAFIHDYLYKMKDGFLKNNQEELRQRVAC